MFNLSGSEIVVILLLALVVLGPEKLPDAMRKAGKAFAELKKLSSGFQDEVRKGFEDPVKEVKQTAAAVKSATKFPAVAKATIADDKPRYNPATDPPPEMPDGSSVAEPLTPAPTAGDEPSPDRLDEAAEQADDGADHVDVVEDTADIGTVDEPVVEADRTT